jgi:hypothetical protein
MIIQKNALYQSLQSAFSTHHPKFPFPKRHDLEDQTEDFQAAFDQFTNEVNEAVRSEIISHKEIERDHYCDKVRSLESDLAEARWWNVFYLFAIGLCVGAFVIGYITGSIV